MYVNRKGLVEMNNWRWLYLKKEFQTIFPSTISFFSYKLKRFLHVALKKDGFKNLTPTPQKIKERKKPCTEENDRVGREESLHKLENYNIY